MRQMTKDMEEKPIEKTEFGRLDYKQMSRKEKKEYKKQQLEETTKDMTPSEKRKYLLYYYKERIIFVIIAVAIVGFVSKTIYDNSRPITISYCILNCKDPLNFSDEPFNNYAKAIGKFDGCQINGNTSTQIKKEDYGKGYEYNTNSQSYISFTMVATTDYYDIIFTDMDGAEYCGMMDIFYPLDRFLDEEHYNKIKDHIVVLKDSNGKPAEYAIDISDTDFAKTLNTGYSDIYIGFPGDQQRNHDAVNDFIDYLF
ncbi:MAG: hypothetical protein K6B68_00380 [Eubacterium sp.]|nr:hypothetical protein [Eubacterium sp.]